MEKILNAVFKATGLLIWSAIISMLIHFIIEIAWWMGIVLLLVVLILAIIIFYEEEI